MESSKSSAFFASVVRMLFGSKMNYKVRYYHQRGHWPNLKNPKDLSEHIISEMFSPGFEKYARFADKYLVREYINEKGLNEILIPLLGVWSTPENIDFESLPAMFIIKANNGCGHHVICRDKTILDREQTIKTLNQNIKDGLNSIEPHYRSIKPCVIAEEFLDCGPDLLPTDYKFTCIKGKVVDVFIAEEDSRGSRQYATVDIRWNILDYTKPAYRLENIPSKPHNLNRMVEIAEILSSNFDFVRVDLYEYKDKIFFGELTFTPWGGLMYSYTDEALLKYGQLWNKNVDK